MLESIQGYLKSGIHERLSNELTPLRQPWENVGLHHYKQNDSGKCKNPKAMKLRPGAYLDFDGQEEDLCD